MKKRKPWTVAVLLALVLASYSGAIAAAPADILYVGDDHSNTVRRFNAATGVPVTTGNAAGVYFSQAPGGLTGPGAGHLMGPRGLVAMLGKLFIVNQNVNTPLNGEILRYRQSNGLFERALVDQANLHAPFLPRGMIAWHTVFYVTDFTADGNGAPGRLLAFGGVKGDFRSEFAPPANFAHAFYPRGMVIGPNGLLYVANVPNFPPGDGGEVLVFNPKNLFFVGAFIVDAGGAGKLNHPEGLVFGPDGNLYITSFAASGGSDTDSIRIYDGATGVFLDKIDLDSANGIHAYAQALLFGPGGKLFVPITGDDVSTTGQIRRYDVTTKQFDSFVPAGGAGEPWYLSFGRTNPGTLSYH